MSVFSIKLLLYCCIVLPTTRLRSLPWRVSVLNSTIEVTSSLASTRRRRWLRLSWWRSTDGHTQRDRRDPGRVDD